MDTTLDKIRFSVALLLILYVVKKIWDIFYIFLIGPWMNKVDIKSYGEWAMVTGSTDEIGKGYARELAALGCNIILVSQSIENLQAVANEIEKDFKVQTKVIQIDFAGDVSIYDKLTKEIKGLEIGTLVNNVGVTYSYPEYFLDLPDWKELITNLINVNVLSMIRVTRIVLPEMTKRRKGVIINVGSFCYRVPCPMLTVYSATKAFVTKFSEGINHEYRDQGILVQCVTPGFVKTKMSELKKNNNFVINSEDYVPKAFTTIGTSSLTHGCFRHALFGFVWRGISEYISEKSTVWATIQNNEYNRKLLLEEYNKK